MENEDTITLTQAEYDARVQDAVDAATKDLISKHNSDMAKMRKENTDLRNASKTQEQIKQEQDQALQDELADLRNYKKQRTLGDRLAKEGLPSHYIYDTRLLNANEGDLDKVIKEVKKEYDATQPQGNPNSSVVRVNTGSQQPAQTKEDAAYEKMGQAIKDALGR